MPVEEGNIDRSGESLIRWPRVRYRIRMASVSSNQHYRHLARIIDAVFTFKIKRRAVRLTRPCGSPETVCGKGRRGGLTNCGFNQKEVRKQRAERKLGEPPSRRYRPGEA